MEASLDAKIRRGEHVKAAEEYTRKYWRDTTADEMRAFLAILIVMGNNKRPSYKSYWTTDSIIQMEGFRTIMSRDRFLNLLRFLHVSNNETAVPRGQPGYDRCQKIRPVIDICVSQWQDAFNIEKQVAIDEGMIGFKGHVFMRQYMPKKPTKWGLKAWILASSQTGFVSNWKLYTGKEGDRAEERLGQKVVTDLMEISPQGHECYCDNFFTCYELLQDLERRGIGCCGTVKSNRKSNPPEIKTFIAKRGAAVLKALSPIFKRCGNTLAVGWFDGL
ncbi:piggyBac transposable element-derived protein 4-like [Lineus longissimus]|uniref:piggyBac transposable element-derived protein 4-like n=1 Tax=Lineus longissimus TaxID=88925 RepID=UPI00315DF968